MNRRRRGAVIWIAVYVVLATLPLLLAAGEPVPPGRGFWSELAVALGFIAFSMLALQFALTARFRSIAAEQGIDTMLHFHREAGLVAFSFALAHPLILFAVEPGYLSYLDPRDSFVRAAALWALLGSLVLVIFLTLFRRRLGLDYGWWRVTHAGLATLIVFIGLVHILRVGYYISVPWKQGVWVGMALVAIGLVTYARVVRPLQLQRLPYRVTSIRPEAGSSWTLTVEPEGHEGWGFEAGQFAWLTLGPSSFSLEQHPFSFASSETAAPALEFTIKELGDFTSNIGSVPIGTRAFVEGPHGAFTLADEAEGAVFVAGGVGITPVMSILRTMRDRADRRPVLLVYAAASLERMIFREELEALRGEMDLRLIRVLEKPRDGWEEERGWVTDELLERLLPEETRGWHHFVCGPDPMMDVVESALLERGIPGDRLLSERFDIA